MPSKFYSWEQFAPKSRLKKHLQLQKNTQAIRRLGARDRDTRLKPWSGLFLQLLCMTRVFYLSTGPRVRTRDQTQCLYNLVFYEFSVCYKLVLLQTGSKAKINNYSTLCILYVIHSITGYAADVKWLFRPLAYLYATYPV